MPPRNDDSGSHATTPRFHGNDIENSSHATKPAAARNDIENV
ncbi:hypothetical protein [Rickettsia endosymbiont of Orchestes rusci]